MCGIVGLCSSAGPLNAAEAERELRDAAALMSHRGPDASGVRVLRSEGIGFGHRRLSILDLDPRADQPMASGDGKLLVTYNGEIYNFRELRASLEREGGRFRTESDTEVLLEGYRAWGIDGLLDRLAGMFAFALFDASRGEVFLARDRAGKKPLYYSPRGGRLIFASELRSILRLDPEARELDPAGLDGYLSLKFAPSPRTLLKGVRRLPPGGVLRWSRGSVPSVRRYWRPLAGRPARSATPSEWLDRIDAALEKATRRRLVSDVPVCLFLSGGIDSSLIAAYLDRIGARDMKAYSIGYGDLPGYSEFEYSRRVAERFPLRYEEIVLDSGEALDALREDAAALDEPVSDWVWVPLHHLSRRAHADGFKVVLVGEGSDELFFGYDVMLKGLAALRRYKRPAWRALAKLGAAALAPVYRRARRGHTRYDLLRRVAAGEPVYMGSSVGFGRSQRHQVAGPRLLAEGEPGAGGEFVASLYRDFAGSSPDPGDTANLVCFIEFFSKMGEVLLQRLDRVTMLSSLEARSPYLDHELVELAFAIPGDRKIPGRRLKGLLKKLARRMLPAEIVDRKKMGFSFPFKEWLRGPLGGAVRETFHGSRLFSDGWVNGDFARRLLREHRSGLVDHAPRVWALYTLASWYDRWIARP